MELISFLLLSFCLLAFGQAPPYAANEPLRLRGATLDRQTLPRYSRLELTLDLKATYDNPFDPEEVDVWTVFTAPGGKRALRVNAFLDQPYTRRLEGANERIEPAGPPVWRVRFTPDVAGVWRYQVHAKDRTGSATLPAGKVRVTASKHPGFIRRSAKNPLVFAWDNGKPFIAVGENMCWGGSRGSFDYDTWLPPLSRAGGNWIRIWMSSWNCALEWSAEAKGDWRSGGYHGAGVYSLDNAWKLDRILDEAERNGIHVMLCLGTFGELTTGGYFNEGQWKGNPYNAANGGPCARPEDFFTSAEARKLYRRRLRYLAARYGCRTNLHSWEFWNEYNAPAPWVAEMSRFLKGTGEFTANPADPYHHLITTTYGNAAVWKIPELDFTQSHSYGTGNMIDHAPVVHNDALEHARFGKPHLMGEFGIDYRGPDNDYDPSGQGINMHNGLWAGAFSGDAGGAMIWWWDNYVHPKNLYGQFTPLRRFVDRVPWTDGAWKPLATDAARVEGEPQSFTDLRLMTGTGWGKASVSNFTITPERGAGNVTLPTFLYSPGKADLRTTPTFRVRYEKPGRFVLRVDEVSAAATIRFVLDGQPVKDVALSAAPPADPNVQPEYEKTELMKEYNSYKARFNKDYGIDVPAGPHTIRLEVTDGDWASIESYTLTGYTSSRFPRVNLYGLTNGREAILWAQNAEHNWKNAYEKKPAPVITSAQTAVHGLPPGRYIIEWWDTWHGGVLSRTLATCVKGALPLRLPDLPTDVAARIYPVKK